jgi:glycosyltransferase involved in cell wall biosynthesis
VQTDDQQRLLKSNFALDASCVVRNFHPMPADEPTRIDPEVLRVSWVANFKPSKNPEIFVDLAESFSERTDIEFVMVGRPGEPRRYASLHQRIRQLRRLRYLGELPVEGVNDLLAQSDVFVNTSSAEGFANTFIQAWLRSVPVVSCYVDPDHCLSVGGAGIMAHNPKGLRIAIDQLLENRAKLLELKVAARSYGMRNHTVDQVRPLIELLRARPTQPSAGGHLGRAAQSPENWNRQ